MIACFPSRTRETASSRQEPACAGREIPFTGDTVSSILDILRAFFLLSTHTNTLNEGWRSSCGRADIHLVNVSQGRKAIGHLHITLDRCGIMRYRNNSRCYVCVHFVSASLFASIESVTPIGCPPPGVLFLKLAIFLSTYDLVFRFAWRSLLDSNCAVRWLALSTTSISPQLTFVNFLPPPMSTLYAFALCALKIPLKLNAGSDGVRQSSLACVKACEVLHRRLQRTTPASVQ